MRAAAVLAASLGGVALAPAAVLGAVPGSVADVSGCAGVTVVVDPGILPGGGDPALGCDPGDGSRSGLDALAGAGFDVEGTARWGPSFVCRVDGRPGAHEEVPLPDGTSVVESCADTPSAHAYWSLWLSGDDGLGWVYAATGVADLTLYPGDVLGLRYGASAQDGGAAGPDAAPRIDAVDAAASAAPATGAASTASEGADTAGGDKTVPVAVGAAVLLALVTATVVVARRRRG